MRPIILSLLSLLFLLWVIVPITTAQDVPTPEGEPETPPETPTPIPDPSLFGVLAERPEFSTLRNAIETTLLQAIFQNEQLTLFAPTNDAFDALQRQLGDEDFEALLDDTSRLIEILQYHVIEGVFTSEQISMALDGREGSFGVQSLQGQYLDVSSGAASVQVDAASLVPDALDIVGTNGVIHTINRVLLPEDRTIGAILSDFASDLDPQFATLLGLLQVADPAINEVLDNPDERLTLLAPTDAALEMLGDDLEVLLIEESERLTNLLQRHLLVETIYSDGLALRLLESDGFSVTATTRGGEEITFNLTDEGLFIGDAQFVRTDIDATNGVIHIIDAPLQN